MMVESHGLMVGPWILLVELRVFMKIKQHGYV